MESNSVMRNILSNLIFRKNPLYLPVNSIYTFNANLVQFILILTIRLPLQKQCSNCIMLACLYSQLDYKFGILFGLFIIVPTLLGAQEILSKYFPKEYILKYEYLFNQGSNPLFQLYFYFFFSVLARKKIKSMRYK